MSWKIIKENKRQYADTNYYLKAELQCDKGKLVLEINWIEQFMYDITVDLYTENKQRKSFFKKKILKQTMYCTLVFYNDRIEKYGYQIMRITQDSPIQKLKRLDKLQKDAVLNFKLSEKYNTTFKTTLPEKKQTRNHFN